LYERDKYYSQEYIISEIEIVQVRRKNGFAERSKVLELAKHIQKSNFVEFP